MMGWLLVFHLLGLAFWIGSLLIATKALGLHAEESQPEARRALEQLERSLFRGWAHPGAAIMVVTGIWLVLLNPGYYLHAVWLHAKLVLVLILIGLDLRLYLRSRELAAGRSDLRRGEFGMMHGLIALVFLAILVLVLLKPFSA